MKDKRKEWKMNNVRKRERERGKNNATKENGLFSHSWRVLCAVRPPQPLPSVNIFMRVKYARGF